MNRSWRSDEFLALWPIGANCGHWVADVPFTGGRAGGTGPTQREAMEAALDDIDRITRDLAVRRSMLQALIDRTSRLPPETIP